MAIVLVLVSPAVSGPGPKAVVMLSGGLDSATVAAIAKAEGFEVHALSFDYGQRHKSELEAAAKVAKLLGIEQHRTVRVDLAAIGGSALTSTGLAVPKATGAAGSSDIPITYVPARNTIFLSIALGMAEVVGAFDLFFGANAIDYSGYPDCRPEYVEAFERLANLATREAVEGRGRFRIQAPLMHLEKSEIILRGIELGVDYSITQSCYDPVNERACGLCDACVLRRRGFDAAGVADPTLYVE